MQPFTQNIFRPGSFKLLINFLPILLAVGNMLAASCSASAMKPGKSSENYFAVGSYAGGILGPSGVGAVGEVAFFDTKNFSYIGALPTRTFPIVVPSPTTGNFLVALPISRGEAKVYEYSPGQRAIIRTKRVGVFLGNPDPEIVCPFKVGPDGVLWIMNRTGLHGVRWPSLSPVCNSQGTLKQLMQKIGNPILIPIKGGLVTIDFLPLTNPRASAHAKPKMFLLSETGHLYRITVPDNLRGVLTLVSVRGRTISGFTATQRFMSFQVDDTGKLLHASMARLPATVSHHILAFHQLSRTIGIALASGGKGLRHKSAIYYISVPSGKLLRRFQVPTEAHTMVVVGRTIYLVRSNGEVVQVSRKGTILRASYAPFETTHVVGGLCGHSLSPAK